jgi:hypothetical protein
MSILPPFDEFCLEGFAIGKLVVSAGELELMMGVLAGAVTRDRDTMLRAVYSVRTTSARIDVTDEFCRPGIKRWNLEADYAIGLRAVKECLNIRNQYAHSHWGHDPNAGLFFTNLEDAAGRADGFSYDWKHIDQPILKAQIDYFDYTKDFMLYLEREYRVRSEALRAPNFPKPPERLPPKRYNPPALHVPPWLNEDNRRQHIERALAAERSATPQERPPSVLKLTEDEWRAKRAKEAREGPQSAE